ncbi:hypothetical protein LEP3755_30480 [Leptolyngbya sp. NIES-3755]|nr:hypothetical protein LEP3755_30480 [Leptolyngbya sp. NIES-3755]
MSRSLSVVPSMSIGYQGCGFDSAPYKLTEVCGDYYENMTSGDKLALIAVLAGWLSEDDPNYALHHAVEDCPMTVSNDFSNYIEHLEGTTPDDALNLIAALTAQIKGKVYAE